MNQSQIKISYFHFYQVKQNSYLKIKTKKQEEEVANREKKSKH